MISAEDYIGHIKCLNEWTKAYDEGRPMVSDKQWDDWYFEIVEYERNYPECIWEESPTQKIDYQVVNELKKVKHNHPMLSLNKTKDIEEVRSFVGNKQYIVMAKMDGLTCSLHYEGGKLISAETRGNSEVGEDITHNAMVIPSIPKWIPIKSSFTVDGEIICTYKDFEKIGEEYKNPRNFAAGSIRLLDSKECVNRNLTFVAWDIINSDFILLSDKLDYLDCIGFIVVPYLYNDELNNDVEKLMGAVKYNAEYKSYPIDGLVIKYNQVNEYNAAGRTDHHFKGGLAYKFYDEEYETRLITINYDVSRNGILTPVAIFEPVDIDGSTVERCSLFNLSVLKEKLGKPYIGQKLWICKRNMIIPYIERAEKDNDREDQTENIKI